MKKRIIIIMAILLVIMLSVVSCGKTDGEPVASSDNTQTVPQENSNSDLSSDGAQTEPEDNTDDGNSTDNAQTEPESDTDDAPSSDDNTQTVPEELYTDKIFTDTSHENSSVTITYPEFNYDGINEAVNAVIFSKVEKFAQEYYTDDYKNLDMKLDFKISYLSDECLSIVFTGSGNVITAAHPNNLCFALTLSTAGEIITLDKIIQIDDAFADTVKDHIDNDLPEHQDQHVAEHYYKSDFMERLSQIGYSTESIQYNISDKYLLLSFPVTHMFGDYATVQIPIQSVSLTDEFSFLGEGAD